jgi:hypothetical protein
MIAVPWEKEGEMGLRRVCMSWLAVVCVAPIAMGDDPISDDFDAGANFNGWTFGNAADTIESSGGNPGGWLHNPALDVAIVTTRTPLGVGVPVHGDWRACGVERVTFDAITLAVDFSAQGRPMSLVLVDDNDTPGNFFDDCFVYRVGPKNVPLPGQGWQHYEFDVPGESQALPAGWLVNFDCAFGKPQEELDKIWNRVITDVDQVILWWHDPDFFSIFQFWNVGVDNIAIHVAEGCYADCNGDGAVNIFDFLCFQGLVTTGDPAADCNGDGSVNIFDFLCFQGAVTEGCL